MTEVTLWNATKGNASESGIRRYEQQLAAGLRPHYGGVDIWRPDGRFRGSTLVSWLLDYRRFGADIVHATSGLAGAPALARRPEHFVVTSHGPIPVRYPELVEDLTTSLQWNLMPDVLRRADAVLANSRFTKQELIDVYRLDASKVHVTPLGVDLDRFKPNHGATPYPVDVLILSSTLPQKRMDTARAVVERLPDVRFYKAGYGERLDAPNVTNLGWLSPPDLARLYASADVLFHPSEYESFGLPLLEALASGTPVVARDCSAIPEVVGNAGVLVDADAGGDAFAEAIETALAADWGDSPREQAERFPWSRTVDRTMAAYEAVVA